MNIDDIYKEIAKLREITEKEAKEEIERYIQQAYQNPNRTHRIKQLQNRVPRKGEIPTADEFLKFVGKEIMKWLESEKKEIWK